MSGCNCDISKVLSWDESTQTLTVNGNLQVNETLSTTNDINAYGSINLMTDTTRFNFGGGFVEKGEKSYVHSSGNMTVGGNLSANSLHSTTTIEAECKGDLGVNTGCIITQSPGAVFSYGDVVAVSDVFWGGDGKSCDTPSKNTCWSELQMLQRAEQRGG